MALFSPSIPRPMDPRRGAHGFISQWRRWLCAAGIMIDRDVIAATGSEAYEPAVSFCCVAFRGATSGQSGLVTVRQF